MRVNLWYVREGGHTAHHEAVILPNLIIVTECGKLLREWGQASQRNPKCKLCLAARKRKDEAILKAGPTELHGVTDKSPYTHFNDKGRDI